MSGSYSYDGSTIALYDVARAVASDCRNWQPNSDSSQWTCPDQNIVVSSKAAPTSENPAQRLASWSCPEGGCQQPVSWRLTGGCSGLQANGYPSQCKFNNVFGRCLVDAEYYPSNKIYGCACSEPCKGGTCVTNPGGGYCDCPIQCKNGGTCDYSTGLCSCPPGYSGPSCEIPPAHLGKLCVPSCKNGGTCDLTTGTCVCPPGYSGSSCEARVANLGCVPPCLNGATCTNQTCVCPPGFSGPACGVRETHLGKLCPGPCKNGGTCDYTTGTCTCPTGYTGPSCGTETGHLAKLCSPPCLNGGTCNHLTGTCDCPHGFTGPVCGTPPSSPSCPPHSFYDAAPCSSDAECATFAKNSNGCVLDTSTYCKTYKTPSVCHFQLAPGKSWSDCSCSPTPPSSTPTPTPTLIHTSSTSASAAFEHAVRSLAHNHPARHHYRPKPREGHRGHRGHHNAFHQAAALSSALGL